MNYRNRRFNDTEDSFISRPLISPDLMLQRIDKHLRNPWSSVIFSHDKLRLKHLWSQIDLLEQMYQSVKPHNTENNLTSSRNSRPLGESFVVNHGRMFTLGGKEMFERLFPGQMSTTLTIHNVQGRYGWDVQWAVTWNVCPSCGKGPVSGNFFRYPGLGAIAEKRPRDQTDFLHSGLSAIYRIIGNTD